MIRILLADDEYYIRERLKQSIDWHAMDFIIVGEAENGTQVLDSIATLKPNLLLLDIKMPEMDGLELAEIIYKRYPDMLIIFLTGFNLFEYAQKALHFGAVGYLLKPIHLPDLIEALNQAKDKLMKQSSHLKNHLKLYQLQQSDSLNFLLFDTGTPPKELLHPINELLPYLRQGIFLLLNVTDKPTLRELKKNIVTLVSELFVDSPCFLFQPTDSLLGLCLCGITDVSPEDVLNQLQPLLSREFHQDVSRTIRLGASNAFLHFSEIKSAYRQALFAVQESIFYPYGSVSYNHAFKEHSSAILPLHTFHENLLLVLHGGQKKQVHNLITTQFDILQTDYPSYNNLLLLINELNNIIILYNDEVHTVLQTSNRLYFQLFLEGYNTLCEMSRWFIQTFDSLYGLKYQNKNSIQHQIVQRAKAVINQNYCNPYCSLDFVSQQVNRSSSYLSGLFKKVCGISVVQYITSCRMLEAQRLLKTGRFRLTEICNQIGYNDVFYFSRRFKQYFGVSPSEFS